MPLPEFQQPQKALEERLRPLLLQLGQEIYHLPFIPPENVLFLNFIVETLYQKKQPFIYFHVPVHL